MQGNRQTGEIIVLYLRAERSQIPQPVRLREALKVLLRRFGLRCICIEQEANLQCLVRRKSDSE